MERKKIITYHILSQGKCYYCKCNAGTFSAQVNEQPYLAKRELLQEGIRLVGFPKDKAAVYSYFGTAVLSGNQGLEGPEVLRVSVQRLQGRKRLTGNQSQLKQNINLKILFSYFYSVLY